MRDEILQLDNPRELFFLRFPGQKLNVKAEEESQLFI